jgi:hypothetical protein
VALDQLKTEALAALMTYRDRRAQLERNLGRGAASDGGPDEEFPMVLSDLEYLFEQHAGDDERLRRQLDVGASRFSAEARSRNRRGLTIRMPSYSPSANRSGSPVTTNVARPSSAAARYLSSSGSVLAPLAA